MPTCDIFIRTYWRDAAWLKLCLASLTAYARGFRQIIVVAPRASEPWLRGVQMPASVTLELTRDYADDYLGQQATKMSADCFTDADFFCHVDSDCILRRPTGPEDLIANGKPSIVMAPYAELGRHWPWQQPTEAFLGWPVAYDFMRRPPFIYPRWIYRELREHSQRMHRIELETYITTRPARGFSEFNVLGAFAYARHREAFVWLDERAAGADDPRCDWYWSWGGLDAATRRAIAATIGPGAHEA